MVDVKSSNHKLIDRARRIFKTLIPSTLLLDEEIDELISVCGGSVKLALVVEKLGCSMYDARTRLDQAGGVLRKAWYSDPGVPPQSVQLGEPQLVLCIDAGGTKCAVVIANKDGIQARAEAGPCNLYYLSRIFYLRQLIILLSHSVTGGHDAALLTISTAVIRAIALLPESLISAEPIRSLPLTRPVFAAAWLGGAGLDRPADLTSVHARVINLLALTDPSTLLVTNDAALLSSAIIKHDTNGVAGGQTKTGVVLITGTGSIAYSFRITSAEMKLTTVPLDRTGGWGYLLGDEGSAYFIGREAIRRALLHRDAGFQPTSFHQAIAEHFGCNTVGAIISAVYAPNQFRERAEAAPMDPDPKLRIASLSRLVLSSAFPLAPHPPDSEALSIISQAADSTVDTVMPLLRDKIKFRTDSSGLIMGGALAQVDSFRDLIVRELEARGEVFASVDAVADAAGSAVELLVKDFLAQKHS